MESQSANVSKRRAWLLAVPVVALYALHQDVWNWRRVEPLLFGFLPVGLAYHAAYSVAAAVLMWFLVRFGWPRELESPAELPAGRQPADPPTKP